MNIQFVVGNNDLDFYKFMNEHGELPDIITCRRFSLHDAAALKDNLMDLSTTEAAGAVYDSYLANFTNTDQTVNWLPLCGEVDGLVANRGLFEEHNIPLPTDYESLVAACQAFEEVGIRGFVADFAYDYTCMEILQGLSIPEITSMEGRMWRSGYEDPADIDTPEVVTTQKTGYDYAVGKKGSPAASAVANTLRKRWGSDVAIGYSSVVSAPVFAGDYSRQQLNWLLANRLAIRRGSLTGAEVKAMMEWLVNVKEDGANPIRHENLIPVTSGMEYKLTDRGDGMYALGAVTINGKPIDDNTVYSVMIFGDDDYIEASIFGDSPMPEELNCKMEATDTNIYTLFFTALEGGNQLEAPTEYVTFSRNR